MLRLVVLGDPIDHSLSPRLHTAALEAAGIEGRYEARRVDAEGMVTAVQELRDGRLDGANVTMPHKRLASQLVDELGAEAARAGSVNTLFVRGGAVVGESTDIAGIRLAWGELPPGPALILGGGGAAAAALLALEGRPLSVSTRHPRAAARLIERSGVAADRVEWGSQVAGAVVVNATPLGMTGEGLPPGLLENASGLFDMPYGGIPTEAVRRAVALGIPAVDGREMLLAQAACSFELWTGATAPLAAMRGVLTVDHSPEPNL
ncbi:MAG: shikimate dehydrogenase [Acidimicrobiia bacterium]|nr:shikimate dehydrogenase [Acidimicrobiia bacterium]NNF88570.1 shikimate dehydrogenase [Acidimicrobiia bacterium]NNL14537.1 shikimate dehydrogenase [Acidimicrobiia bacterium]